MNKKDESEQDSLARVQTFNTLLRPTCYMAFKVSYLLAPAASPSYLLLQRRRPGCISASITDSECPSPATAGTPTVLHARAPALSYKSHLTLRVEPCEAGLK